ncbi:MAG TPA: LPS export ABC transporter permease LptF, partial [Desulfobacteraceae bacterium]|nr:LPS export ABC transporter permease LptF [Desulfobacteraceae bacterium]
MIIHRALYREASSSAIAVVTVLLVLFMFLTLTKLMGKAAAGDYSSEAVWLLLGLQLLVKLDVLIPLSLYIGLIITLGRWYRDNEMTVLAACGIGVLSLLRPILILSAIFILVVAVLSFYLTPKAAHGVERIKGESGKHQKISGITPGVFTESGKGKRIFYVEKISKSKNPLQTIFLRSIEPGKTSVLLAKSGYRRTDKKTGDRFIVLKQGRIYEEQLDRQRYGEIIFDSYEIRMQPRKDRFLSKKSSSLPSTVIMKGKTAAHRAEWHWRMAKP